MGPYIFQAIFVSDSNELSNVTKDMSVSKKSNWPGVFRLTLSSMGSEVELFFLNVQSGVKPFACDI